MTEIHFEKPPFDGSIDKGDVEFAVGDRPRQIAGSPCVKRKVTPGWAVRKLAKRAGRSITPSD